MNANRFWIILIIVLLTLLSFPQIHAQEINLMPSGDPEKEGWKIFRFKMSSEIPIKAEWHKNEGRQNGDCFYMSAADIGLRTFGWKKKIDVPVGAKALAFSVWARGKGSSGAYISEIAATGLRTDPAKSSLSADALLQGEFDWTRMEIVLPLKPDVKEVILLLSQGDDGESWFDGLTMRLADPPDVGPEVGAGIVEVKGSVQAEAKESVSNVRILFPLPLANEHQVPLTFRFWTEPDNALAKNRIYKDKPGNWVCEAYLSTVEPDKPVAVRWTSMVLCAPDLPPTLPEKVAFPKKWPREVKPWLKSTFSVESDDPRFQAIAKEILSKNTDIIGVVREAEKVNNNIEKQVTGESKSQRSTAVLETTSSCTGEANRLAAILRACGVPARIMAGYMNGYGPLQTHYRVEAYIPGYGWVSPRNIDSASGHHGFDQIEVSSVFPECENLAKVRYCTTEGVPYLSLNENPRCEGTLWFRGDLGSIGMDHSAEQWLSYISETSNTGWDKVMKNARKNWIKWLKNRKNWQSGKLETALTQEQLQDITFEGLYKLLR